MSSILVRADRAVHRAKVEEWPVPTYPSEEAAGYE